MLRRIGPPGWACLLLVLLAVPPLFSQPAPARPAPAPPTPAFATVNQDPVTRAQWEGLLRDFWGAKALRDLVEERLIIQEAHRLGVTVSNAEIDQRLAEVKTDYPNEATFTAMLGERGLSVEALKRELKRQLLLGRLVDKLSGVTDEQVVAYYQAHISEFSNPTRVHLFVITQGDQRQAYLAAERIAKDEPFTTVATELSQDEHAAEGGDWGWVTAESLQPEALRVAAFALEPGAYSEPVEAEGKFHVLWVKEREPGSATALAEAKGQIKERLRADKGVSQKGVVNSLLRRATVKVNDPAWAFVAAEMERLRQIQVVVDGKPLDLPQPPVRLESGRILVPAKSLLAAIGATTKWWPEQRTLQAVKGDNEVWVSPDSEIGIIQKTNRVTLDQKPEMRDGVLYVSPRWIVEQLGGSVAWSTEENALQVKSVKPAPPAPTGAP